MSNQRFPLRLRRLFSHPITWAGVYLFIWAGCSLVFFLLGQGALVSSTTSSDPEARRLQERAEAAMTKDLGHPDRLRLDEGARDPLGDNIRVSLESGDKDRLKCVAYATVTSDLSGNRSSRDRLCLSLFSSAIGFVSLPSAESSPADTIVADALLPETAVLTIGGIVPSPDAESALFDFVDFSNGDPNAGPTGARVIRMAYFSTVTITTLGFGDILPQSDAARLFVGIESILGVLVSGAFLLAIGNRIASSQGSEKCK
jgi:Ion channel